jgi:hypothetical protein
MGGRGGRGSLEPRTAIEGSFSAWGGLGKLDRGLGRRETFFPDSNSDRDSDENFQISRKLGLDEFFCLLDSQPCLVQTFGFRSILIILRSAYFLSFDAYLRKVQISASTKRHVLKTQLEIKLGIHGFFKILDFL